MLGCAPVKMTDHQSEQRNPLQKGSSTNSVSQGPAVGVVASRPDAEPAERSVTAGVSSVGGLLALMPAEVPAEDGTDSCRVRFLKDGEAFEWALEKLSKLRQGSRALIRAYSLDQPCLVEALRSAASKGCQTCVVADKSQSAGRTKQQLQVLKELRSVGVRVRLTSGHSVNQAYASDNRSVQIGRNLKGLHHAKSLFTQEQAGCSVNLLVGSCNFTTSSKANKEAGVGLVLAEESATIRSWLAAFEEVFSAGIDINQLETEGGQGATRRRLNVKQRPTDNETDE